MRTRANTNADDGAHAAAIGDISEVAANADVGAHAVDDSAHAPKNEAEGMHEFHFQGITVIVRAIEDDIDDEDAVRELMPPHVICQMAHDLRVAIRRRIIARIFYDDW
ncbi:hypothetical protein PVAP13_6KG093706 [Panicum virgatum]|uniref:Uncharacterized protein n=1 Tax=Panicum virgatum TaxID=38727 RepID=A0A8T0RCD6_PANVG|nr:hypothetical protein PVAP13_6KG093706 [Panicum virgatum]